MHPQGARTVTPEVSTDRRRPARPTGHAEPTHLRSQPRRRATGDAAVPRIGSGRVTSGAVVVTAAIAAFDLWLTGRLSLFFDLCFVLVCLSAAMVVGRRGLFAAAVLGPLLLGCVVAVLAAVAPEALTASSLPFVGTWLSGLAHHGTALAASQLVALAVVGLRAAQTP